MPPYVSIGGYSDPPTVPCFSLEVSPGEMVAVTAPPGSGKSNLIHSIAGIRKPAAGSIKVMGSRAGTLRARRSCVFVFQEDNFTPGIPVRIQLERRLAVYGNSSPRTFREDISRWCLDAGLGRVMNLFPEMLNLSDLQLFSLAPLALGRHQVAVLDEPAVFLSPSALEITMEILYSFLDRGAVVSLVQPGSYLVGKADKVVTLG